MYLPLTSGMKLTYPPNAARTAAPLASVAVPEHRVARGGGQLIPRTVRTFVVLTHKLSNMDKRETKITSVEFRNFKAFQYFSVKLENMNILVGPNNCGKSTIIGAFRVLRAGIRKAMVRSAEIIRVDDEHQDHGYLIAEENLPISTENVHTDYAETDTTITFRLSNNNKLKLFFPKKGGVILLTETDGKPVRTPAKFRSAFPVTIGVVPVLGPVEHNESIVREETVQREIATHRASRHFRNYWKYFPEGFDKFADLVKKTWPGMEILPPEIRDYMSETIFMFCLENRITRELYWSGFGFQIWCQLLTHISHATNDSVIVIDEPEIYLHPDVQRQLLGILREAGPDIVLATHSTEIMSEADPSEILLIDKSRQSAKRLRDVGEVQTALELIGSVQNITLTQLARNRRVVFVEDMTDFTIIRRFAKKIGFEELAAGIDLTPIKSEGFSSWSRITSVAWGIEKTLGQSLKIAVIYDRDFWCDEEIASVNKELAKYVALVHFHQRKEIENYLLVPNVLERALHRVIRERANRSNQSIPDIEPIGKLLDEASSKFKTEALSQYAARKSDFLKKTGKDPATIFQEILITFEEKWNNIDSRMEIAPGKDVLHLLRTIIQNNYHVNLTDFTIVDSFQKSEIPEDLIKLLENLENFRKSL